MNNFTQKFIGLLAFFLIMNSTLNAQDNYGCIDSTAINYNPFSNIDDGSCEYPIIGCMNIMAFNYDSSANIDDGSCTPFVYGCTYISAYNYNQYANTDDGSCELSACTDPLSVNFNPDANIDDGSCLYSPSYVQYLQQSYFDALDSAAYAFAMDEMSDAQELADTITDMQQRYDAMIYYMADYISFTLDSSAVAFAEDEAADLMLLQQTILEADYLLAMTLDSAAYAFAWDETADAQELADTINDMQARYDANNAQWLALHQLLIDSLNSATWSFSDFEAWFDVELTNAILEIQNLTNSLEELEEITSNQVECSYSMENFPLYLPEGWGMFGYTCLEPMNVEDAFSSEVDKLIIVKDNDGNAYLPEYFFNGIGDLIYSRGYQIKTYEEILDFSFCPTITGMSDEMESPQYEVGDYAEGGIVFWVDSTGQHGLVAAAEDLTEGATEPDGWGVGGYEWGCHGTNVSGADGMVIGTGYQNTMDILNQGCLTDNGGITAAQAALDSEINGYSDWYLPSRAELVEMYITIGNGGPESNIGGFVEDGWPYWSSSENGSYYAWTFSFDWGYAGDYDGKDDAYRVRVIRSF